MSIKRMSLRYRLNCHNRLKHSPKKKICCWILLMIFSEVDGIKTMPLFYTLKYPAASFWHQIKIKEDLYYESLFIIFLT